MWGNKSGSESAGLLPGRATIGPILLMMITPFIALLLIETNLTHGGDFLKMGAALIADPVATLLGVYKAPSWPTIQMLLAFAVFQLALMRLMPGKTFIGPISPSGDRPHYTANGFQCFLATLAAFFVFSDFGLGYFPASIVYDRYAEALSALTAGSFAFCALLYVKGHIAPSSADSGTSGNPVIDFYWGMEASWRAASPRLSCAAAAAAARAARRVRMRRRPRAHASPTCRRAHSRRGCAVFAGANFVACWMFDCLCADALAGRAGAYFTRARAQ